MQFTVNTTIPLTLQKSRLWVGTDVSEKPQKISLIKLYQTRSQSPTTQNYSPKLHRRFTLTMLITDLNEPKNIEFNPTS
jgi:hypothetical protein